MFSKRKRQNEEKRHVTHTYQKVQKEKKKEQPEKTIQKANTFFYNCVNSFAKLLLPPCDTEETALTKSFAFENKNS